MKILTKWNRSWCKNNTPRYVKYLRKRGMNIGDNLFIAKIRRTYIDMIKPENIEIGNNVWINRDFTLLTHDNIGQMLKNVYDDYNNKDAYHHTYGKVRIGNNVTFGMKVTLLKGADIGDNVFVAYGSVVTGKIPSNCIAGGVPAKKICDLDDYYKSYK